MKKTVLALVLIFGIVGVCSASPLTDYSKGKVAIDFNYRPSFDMEAKPYVEASGTYNGNDVGAMGQEVNQYINENIGDKGNFDGKTKLDWGITVGMGNNWAFQYRGLKAEADGKTYTIFENKDEGFYSAVENGNQSYNRYRNLSVTLTPQVKSQEFNALYKFHKNFSVFAGVVEVTPSIKVSPGFNQGENYPNEYNYERSLGGTLEFKGKDKYLGQLGVIGTAKIADKTNVYGIAAIGKDYRNLSAGIGYEISKNWEFDVTYRHTKFEDLSFASVYSNYSHEYLSPALAEQTSEKYTESAAGELKSDITVKGWGFGLTYKF